VADGENGVAERPAGLEELLRISGELAGEHDPRVVIGRLSEVAQRLMDVEVCSIFVHDPRQHTLYSVVHHATDSAIHFPETHGIAGLAFTQRKVVVCNDPYNDYRFNPEIDRKTGFTTRGLFAAPIIDNKGVALGVVELVNRHDGVAFEEADAQRFAPLFTYISAFTQNVLLHQRLEETQEAIVLKLASASRFKDKETHNHTVRVGHYAGLIAEGIGLDADQVRLVRLAAPMHDIGKVGIPDAIIHKEGALSTEERTEINRHTIYGHDILAGGGNALTDLAAVIALQHHERWDGTGYPNRVSRKNIDEAARMTSIADVFDALTSKRAYKEAWPLDKAFDELKKCGGSHLDPYLLTCFLDSRPRVVEIREQFPDTPAPEGA
jgi:HD-GYP domain-containing protein (c-di-GMP phosphodiesterase class II)